jgi:hypothetical protein
MDSFDYGVKSEIVTFSTLSFALVVVSHGKPLDTRDFFIFIFIFFMIFKNICVNRNFAKL